MVPRLGRLVAGLSPRMPGLGLRSVHVRFLVDETALGKVFLLVFCFPLTISFHQCFILIFTYCCSYQKNKRAKHRNIPQVSAHSEVEDHWTEKYFPLFLFVYMYKHPIYTYMYITCVYAPSFPWTCPLFRPRNFLPVISLKF